MAGRVGKFRLAFLLSLVSCGMILAAPSTREDVVRMLKSRTPESSILVAIRSSHTAYDLTADDIADLREAGASQAVIDAMIDSGASTAPVAQPSDSGDLESSQAAAETAGPETGTEPETVTEYVPVPVAPPPPAYYGYPFYPLYAPVYYPVYDPFFSGFYGPWFSFGFVSSFGFHTIFPCHSSFVVVGHGCDFHHFSGGGYVGSRSRAFSTPRFSAQGGRPGDGGWRGPGQVHPGPTRAPSGPGGPAGHGSIGTIAPRVGPTRPGPAPHAQQPPRGVPSQTFHPAPRFQTAPRFSGPRQGAPHAMMPPASRGFPGGGGFRNYSLGGGFHGNPGGGGFRGPMGGGGYRGSAGGGFHGGPAGGAFHGPTGGGGGGGGHARGGHR